MSGVRCRSEDSGWGGRYGKRIGKLRSPGPDYYHRRNTNFTRTGRIVAAAIVLLPLLGMQSPRIPSVVGPEVALDVGASGQG
ncbi:hypothetical protein D8674_008238 [Pyrus ussuriensis x Pyrus communis]|uniref:Uncharacterized protein n=1 Tax=Pyrus ussuriensis x Pyrus communis TaxID=2448454 RepID=A0A5N5HSG9_9ROSA|nr:hypothetical protein D8674_008238 [Pyrus ussuriensis x Pyrus communis]